MAVIEITIYLTKNRCYHSKSMGNIVLKLLLNETEKMARILLNSRMLNCMIHPLMSRKRIFAFIGDTLSFTLLVFFFF